MARDSQAALVALNRFGFGARGGAAGDFVNAASDPRGFVKADLSRPNGVLLEIPGLASTPALAKAVFRYQFEIQQVRAAASKSGAGAATESPAEARPPQRRNLSLGNIANDISPKESPKESAMQPAQDNAAAPTETMQPNAPRPAPQPANIIQKTFRAEALARMQRAIMADCGFAERLVVFWSNHFCISAGKGGLLPEQVWDGPDIPERQLYLGHPSGSAMPLVWAHSEHIKLLRSLRDGAVFDMPPQGVQRYIRERTVSPFRTWQFVNKIRSIPAGKILRIEAAASAIIHWSLDGWKTVHDSETAGNCFGVYHVDLPVEQARVGDQVQFTFFWTGAGHWEGVDFSVRIDATESA